MCGSGRKLRGRQSRNGSSNSAPHKQRRTFLQSALSLLRNSRPESWPCSAKSLHSCASTTFSFHSSTVIFMPCFPHFQPIISPSIFLLSGSAGGFFSFCFTVGANLAASTRGLFGSNIIAVAGVIASGQPEISAAILAAARAVAVHQTTVEVGVQKVHKAGKLHLLRNHKLACPSKCVRRNKVPCDLGAPQSISGAKTGCIFSILL